jgi:uncharacterized repeat protein (TIGR03803 family)
MKIKLLILGIFICNVVNAQFAKLLDFNGANGLSPYGIAVPSGSTVYGMTNTGGSANQGVIFSIGIDGCCYKKLWEFSGANGAYPYASLTLGNGVLYGVTSGGGFQGSGTVFSINTDGSGFKTIHNFRLDSLTGSAPQCKLVLDGSTLYGTTLRGGVNGNGTLFKINTDGTGFFKLAEIGNSNSLTSLTQFGSTLYGVTLNGGLSGGVYSIHTDGTALTKLVDFTNAMGISEGGLSLINNKLYGTFSGGNAFGKGAIYSLNMDGTGFKNLYDFDGTYGQNPFGGITFLNGLLYGTSALGDKDMGSIFSINPDGSNIKKLYSFTTANGSQPRATLTILDGVLYGTTVAGGTSDYGVVFKFKDIPYIPICMVTVDENSKFNRVIWEKPIATTIDSFIVLRETTTNLYQKVGAVGYSALSEFTDTMRSKYFPFTGNPNSGTYRYKMQVKTKLGELSVLSPFQNTLYVTQSSGTFNWNSYQIEGQPTFSVGSYTLFRDDLNTGSFHSVSAVSGSQTTVTDPDFKLFPKARWRVEASVTTTCNSSNKTDIAYNSIKSNSQSASVTGIATIDELNGISIFPNPSTGNFTISKKGNGPEKLTYSIKNIFGQEVKHVETLNLSPDGETFDLTGQSKGVYFLEINCDGLMDKRILILQ